MNKDEGKHYFFKRIAEARALNALTQQELAENIGISQRQIAAYEAGDAFPRQGVLIKLANELGTTPEWLATGVGNIRVSPNSASKKIPILQPNEIFDWFVTQGSTAKPNKLHSTSCEISALTFAMIINDEAMSSSSSDGFSFPKGTIVIFEPIIEAKDQDFVIAVSESDPDHVVFRRYFSGLITTTLMPLDSRYPQENIDNKEIKSRNLVFIPAIYVETPLPALLRLNEQFADDSAN